MGTNYYCRKAVKSFKDDAVEHLGKRSAAGKWCWACNRTLCLSGEKDVHKDLGPENWATACLQCSVPATSLNPSKTAVVKGCCSFSWAVDPMAMMGRLKDDAVVEDEYGEQMTAKEFWQQAINCRIHYYDFIGTNFS